MIREFDAILLAVCTKISHATQRAIGLTSYFIAKIGIALAAVDIGVQLLNYLHQFLRHKTPLSLMLLQLIILVDFYRRTFFLTKAEEHLGSGIKPRELMAFTVGWFNVWWRLLWLGMLLWDTVFLIVLPPRRGPYWFADLVSTIFFSFGMSIFYYFVAVDPLPPGKSKVRVWMEHMRAFGKLTPAKAENP
jgi:hypothetical protein